MALPPDPCICRMKNIHTPMMRIIGSQLSRMVNSGDIPSRPGLAVMATPFPAQPFDQRGVFGGVGGERLPARQMAADVAAFDGHIADLALFNLFEELGVTQRALRARPHVRAEHLEQRDQKQGDDHPQRDIAAENCSNPWNLVGALESHCAPV